MHMVSTALHKPTIPWQEATFFFDIDDTLIDTEHTTKEASAGIERVIASRFDTATGAKVRREFTHIFETLMVGHRAKTSSDWDHLLEEKVFHDEIIRLIDQKQQRIAAKYGKVKKWSREFFVWLAATRVGLRVSSEVVIEASDAYWVTLAQKAALFPHVSELFHLIGDHKRPVYLLTSSDARLTLAADGQFDYDPAYSEGLKRERIELLREKGLDFHGVSIGDPEDKPHKDFFQKGIAAAEKDLGRLIDRTHAIMVGDSYKADLATPKEQLGFGLVVEFVKGKEDVEIVDGHHIATGNLMHLVDFLT